MSDIPHKPKRPPTFLHYPKDRAKKLKKAWVETAKIRSKWKAQKRKEGLASTRSAIPSHEDEGQKPEHVRDGKHGREIEGNEGPSYHGSESHASQGTGSDSEDGIGTADDNAKIPPLRARNQSQKRKRQDYDHPEPHNKNTFKAAGTNDRQSSLRELFQQAYSKSSLHTYKSDPLKRRGNTHPNKNQASSRGGRSGAVTGRGQPNMKLRMNAMLEKIKRDHP